LSLIPLTLILSPKGRGKKSLLSEEEKKNKSPLPTGERENLWAQTYFQH